MYALLNPQHGRLWKNKVEVIFLRIADVAPQITVKWVRSDSWPEACGGEEGGVETGQKGQTALTPTIHFSWMGGSCESEAGGGGDGG